MRYEPCAFSEIATFDAYLASLSSPIDSFLEDHILDSQFHRILVDEREVGSFAIHKGSLLTQFHIVGQARRLGQRVFAELLTSYGITAAFVPTCDEFFLYHVLDVYADLKKQAYFFVDGGEARPPAIAADLEYRLAEPSDVGEIIATSGDFLDAPAENVAKGEIHVGLLHREMVAIGIIVKSRILRQHASIGMFTEEAHRQQGIGTSTILYLKRVCRDEGIVPISGCWYGNHNSKRTLEAAGMVAATRLLRFEFS
jgi:GNAT superfamily N-acetyltransferase